MISRAARWLVLAGCFLACACSAASRPNIILILADDLGYGDLGCYGQSRIRTPNIDRLAEQGMRFTDAYAGTPVCGPSRSVLMTGLHTGHTRIRGNNCLAGGLVRGRNRRMHLTDRDPTVAKVLQGAGYRTCLVGKWHLEGFETNAIPLNRGFDEFYGWQMWAMETHEPVYFPAKRFFNREIRALPENADGKQGLYETDLVFHQGCEFIERNTHRPFFLFLSPTAPHDPLRVPDFGPYGKEPWTTNARTYAAMVHYLDLGVGRILKTLRETGLDTNSIVFFASDNGPRSSPAPGLTEVADFFDSNGPLRGYKRDLYEGGVRVPFIVRWPGHVAPGTTNAALCFFADFLPTAAELAGGAAGATDGVSLMPALLNPAGRWPERFLYWEFWERGFEQAVRWGQWKAIRHAPGQPLELYNLSTDLDESRDLSSAEPATVARMEQYLKTARTESENWPLSQATRSRSKERLPPVN
jgi:arylsulfatase A-like enzyme